MSGRVIGVLDPSLPEAERLRVAAWVQTLGIEPRDTFRIELRYDGRLYARVYQWATDKTGHLYCPHDHDHWDFTVDGCEFATREPYDVTIISAAGVQAVSDRMRAWADAMRNLCVALAPVIAVVGLRHRAMKTEYHRRRNRRRSR